MCGAELFVIPFTDYRTVLYDHASYRRVWLNAANAFGRKFKRPLHVFDIIH
jgi:hypothetical protein